MNFLRNNWPRGLDEQDRDFFTRVFSTDMEIYEDRIKSIEFTENNNVLDAGCGFGQWSAQLSSLNLNSLGLDSSKGRVQVAKEFQEYMRESGDTCLDVGYMVGSIEDLPFSSEVFDAVFCYSVVYKVDYGKAFKEFYRVLEDGGKLYICTNSLGWAIYNILRNPNPSEDFSPRSYGFNLLVNTLKRKIGFDYSGDVVMSRRETVRTLKELGFREVQVAGEGELNLEGNETESFYPTEYMGLNAVYEVFAVK